MDWIAKTVIRNNRGEFNLSSYRKTLSHNFLYTSTSQSENKGYRCYTCNKCMVKIFVSTFQFNDTAGDNVIGNDDLPWEFSCEERIMNKVLQ